MCTNTSKMRFLENLKPLISLKRTRFVLKIIIQKEFPKPLKKFTGFQQKDSVRIYLEQNRAGVVNLGLNTTVALALLKSVFQRINKGFCFFP